MECYPQDQNNQHNFQTEQKQQQQQDEDEDDYIDMEVNSSSFTHSFSPTKTTSHNQTREFEFQMSSSTTNMDTQPTTSPADELFYKGKLLPLHLPPRLQMVQKLLLQDSSPNTFEDVFTTPLSSTNPLTTPFTSCPVSPAQSCHASKELHPDDESFHDHHKGLHKKSWTRNIKTKIKSLFGIGRKNDNMKETKKNLFPCRRESADQARNERVICHRRSFSSAFKRRSSMNKLLPSSSSGSSSSSSSSSSTSSSLSHSNSGGHEMQVVKRNRSSKSETEASLIQGAIAHCKQSQLEFGFHLLSSSFGACKG